MRDLGQHPQVAEVLVVLLEELGKAGRSRRCAAPRRPRRVQRPRLEPAQSLVDVAVKPGARYSPSLGMSMPTSTCLRRRRDAASDVLGQLLLVVRLVERARLHAFDDLARADQAADVRGQNAFSAALHAVLHACRARCRCYQPAPASGWASMSCTLGSASIEQCIGRHVHDEALVEQRCRSSASTAAWLGWIGFGRRRRHQLRMRRVIKPCCCSPGSARLDMYRACRVRGAGCCRRASTGPGTCDCSSGRPTCQRRA